MKHFLIASAVLAFVLCLVCVNCALVRRAARGLLDEAHALCEENAAEFEKDWKKARKLFSLSAHECELERVDEASCDAVSAAEQNDAGAFAAAKRRLEAALEELLDYEDASFYGVF